VYEVQKIVGGSPLTMQTGKVAKQADGAVTVQYGDTVVLVAAVTAPQRPDFQRDYFPLLVDYREKLFAAGKIPGGRFYKREGRPSLKEVITCRLIDRPIRTLFPKHFRDEVQVSVTVLSADPDYDPDILALLGASTAITLAGMPFAGPFGVVRVARSDGELTVNPSNTELEGSDLNVVVAGTRERVVMIEAVSNEVPEADMVAAIAFAQEQLQVTIDLQEELAAQAGRPKTTAPEPPATEPLLGKVRERYYERVLEKLQVRGKKSSENELKLLYANIEQELIAEDESLDPKDIKHVLEQLEYEIVRARTLAGQRVDGRSAEALRELNAEVGVLPRTHGSAIFSRGETQALVVATLGTTMDEEMVDGLGETFTRKFMLQYNHPAFSVGEIKPDRGPARREIGHGNLAERAIQAVIPSEESFPYTIRVVSDILESNGSTSMATVCGATLCLMDAGVPIVRPVAGISIGLVMEGDRWATLTDIAGLEDHYGDMDFKVAGTQNGITAIQMDLKVLGIGMEIVEKAISQARDARMEILRTMLGALAAPREDVSAYAPKLVMLRIPKDKIGAVIGPGGKTIRQMEEDTGCKLEIEEEGDEGKVTISSTNAEMIEKAREMIAAMTTEPEVGTVYDAKVVSVKDFGCFVEILPGVEGLVHVSELSTDYVKRVEDVAKEGDEFQVKLISVDNQGRLKLSKRAVDDPNWTPPPPRSDRPRSGGRDRDSRRGDSDRRGGGSSRSGRR